MKRELGYGPRLSSGFQLTGLKLDPFLQPGMGGGRAPVKVLVPDRGERVVLLGGLSCTSRGKQLARSPLPDFVPGLNRKQTLRQAARIEELDIRGRLVLHRR